MTVQSTSVSNFNLRPALTIPHHVNPALEVNVVYHVESLLQKSGSLANGTNKSRRMSLII